ncbi:ATP-binding protein [Lactobacillus crispatus]|uniref:ATP-binding protein n=1 Tax=Lactobacillus crispatus TaxID=47770 RepID=A0AB73BQN1_9LACO|nr:ATP-binding protein [Lactobacillus crispatus]KAA8794072.1 ATP-binding protein [Lactobacillus crispatus]KAA8796930.1 ATP-binding protein [Lactobacillus crispatus]KAA8798482.1 ATP-binding protein [Lactobacillus crispatus]KAA8801760.1 ATP-binding protein [Lactobacillus crispatus]KAA8803739.1 ATP-binding protein [Lactobacillus crispatus]
MIKRTIYLNQIEPFIDKDIIKIITGIRRSGKSVLLQQIQTELVKRGKKQANFIYMNFENLQYEALLDYRELNRELVKRIGQIDGKAYLFLDEIQKVASWEKTINSLRASYDCDIYITGSNSQLLSGELATEIAGRYVEIKVYPFSFAEFLEAINSDRQNLDRDFATYMELGGMPFLTLIYSDQQACNTYLQDIYSSVVLKDIVDRHAIRNVDLLQRITSYLSSEIGHPISATGISKFLKNEHRTSSIDTILDYISYTCDAYLFTRVLRTHLQGKQTLKVNDKYYITDHGLRQTMLDSNQQNIDQILENIVFIELLRRGYKVSVGINDKKEIDFVAQKGNDKRYYQVTYILGSQTTIEREFGAYDGIADNYPKYVLSMDKFDMSRNGIIHQNIIDFLLEE